MKLKTNINARVNKQTLEQTIRQFIADIPFLGLGAHDDTVFLKIKDLALSFGHFTYLLNPTDIMNLPRMPERSGIRYFILQDRDPIATVDFRMDKKQKDPVFSHFTAGPGVRTFYSLLHHIEDHKIPGKKAFEVEYIKCPCLSLDAIRLISKEKELILVVPRFLDSGKPEFLERDVFYKYLKGLLKAKSLKGKKSKK